MNTKIIILGSFVDNREQKKVLRAGETCKLGLCYRVFKKNCVIFSPECSVCLATSTLPSTGMLLVVVHKMASQ